MTATGYNVDRWSDLITRQRRGEFGDLAPAEESVFSVLAHWDNGLEADELSIRAGVSFERLPYVCLSLAEKLDASGSGDVNFIGGRYRLEMSA